MASKKIEKQMLEEYKDVLKRHNEVEEDSWEWWLTKGYLLALEYAASEMGFEFTIAKSG